MGRPEADDARLNAMRQLGNGLYGAGHHKDALSVREAELAMMRRLGAPEDSILVVQSNLATTYSHMGRFEDALRTMRDVYSGRLKLNGEENEMTLVAANNYANLLQRFGRHEEASSLMRKIIPVARRIIGETKITTLRIRWLYALALSKDQAATLDDLRESVATLEDVAPLWTRIFGEAHPETPNIKNALREARKTLAARAA